MQGQRSIFDPYPETVDLNLGSNSNMDESDDWNMLSPMETRLLNNDLSSEINFSCVNNSNNHQHHHNFRSFSNWDVGESSSRASLLDHVSNDGLKINQLESSSSTIRHPHDSFIAGPSNTQSSVSNHIPMNVNLNIGYDGNNDDDDDDMGFMDFYKSGRSELQSSGFSCKRKALEGTSAHPTGGGLSFFPQASRSLNISPPLFNPVPIFRHEPPNARVSENNSQTHIGLRGSVPYNNISSTGNNPTKRPNINSSHSIQSSNRQILLNEFLDQTSRGPPIVPPVNSSNFLNQQPPLMHVPSMPRNAPQFPWGSNIGSRTGSGGSSSLLRNNEQYHNFVPPSDSMNLVQDPTNWSLSTGNSGAPSSSRNGTRPFNALWPPQHNPTMPSQPYEFPPWTLFPPSAELESGGQRGHFSSFPVPAGSSSSTSEDNRISAGVPSQRHHYQPFSRNELLMEVPSEDWRALASDIEGRQRLVSEIRQVLNAMRRGENVRAEDYMLFDPFINGVAELHDRHRDMRLDVDNMSYEELLALEERIGNVNTGLSEEVILKSMKQRKHISFMAISTKNSEPCCICQENYDNGDNIGRLDCGHDFHTDCIKQWLTQKNICPICKMPGLAT